MWPLTPEWPQAVMSHMIVTNKGVDEKRFRALQIVRLLGQFDGQTVLDVGCNDGYIARELGNQAKKVVGYDLRHAPTWDKLSNGVVSFTTERNEVEANRYDTIVVYDVLDHLEGEDPIKFMEWLNSLLVFGGRIFVRTHPWTSKHGGHLYENGQNKAFLHLAMTADELIQAGIDLPPAVKLSRPMAAYQQIFESAGLKVSKRKGHVESVDPFFSAGILERIIKVTWKGDIDPADALKIMGNSFIDYDLTTK